LADLLESLPERERRVVYLRFFEDRTQAEIAEEVGMSQVQRFPLLIDPSRLQDAGSSLKKLLEVWPLFRIESVWMVWWQNVRVLILAMVLGVFTFGVMGVIPLLGTMGVTGYLLALLTNNGLNSAMMIGLLLPHGILEIPAAILATAAVLEAGAILATPTPNKTIGEVWLATLADWAKVMVGVVIPLLVVAAAIEVWITPRIALLLVGQ
ncbi:MAG TPA: stage II sporulation protein M, partial [Anaerolinea sp.]|nr:stage II sporulation protein M [Anaerolinea sp.]